MGLSPGDGRRGFGRRGTGSVKIRDAKKQASRARVVEAAKALFSEIGFQETTVRMIAERAGLSPGGVFTTFEDKVAILCQILADSREALLEELKALVPTLTGSTRDRLHAIISHAHQRELPRLRMVLAHIGASYGWSAKLEAEYELLHQRLISVGLGLLAEGVARGEVRKDLDAELLMDLITSAYMRNSRTAYYAGLSAEALDDRIRRQLELMFDGAGVQ